MNAPTQALLDARRTDLLAQAHRDRQAAAARAARHAHRARLGTPPRPTRRFVPLIALAGAAVITCGGAGLVALSATGHPAPLATAGPNSHR